MFPSTRIPLTKGINDLLAMDKQIDTEEQDDPQDKVVKLRFTRKQFQAFREACNIFKVVAEDERFVDFVKSVLGADVKVPTINKQMVQPIVDAPMKIPIKLKRAQREGGNRESYFTNRIDATDNCVKLYDAVKDEGVELKQDISSGGTCVTDVRTMMSKYVSAHDLRDKDGIVIDDLILELAQSSLQDNIDRLHRMGNRYIIPKGDRKVMPSIVNEIAFGKGDERYHK